MMAQISCKVTITKTMWDAKGNRAKGKRKENEINLLISLGHDAPMNRILS